MARFATSSEAEACLVVVFWKNAIVLTFYGVGGGQELLVGLDCVVA